MSDQVDCGDNDMPGDDSEDLDDDDLPIIVDTNQEFIKF